MSKKIDYSKWDNLEDYSSDEDKKVPKAPGPTYSSTMHSQLEDILKQPNSITMLEDTSGLYDIDEMVGKKAASTQEQQETAFDHSDIMATLQKSMKEGKVSRLSKSDVLSASALLDAVTPKGIRMRAEARAKKGDCYIREGHDPVTTHLWSLTMKLREGPEHAEELLKNDVLNRILSIMKETRSQKYRGMGKRFLSIEETDATPQEQLLAKELCADQNDLISCTAVLHELCRYRLGCVALAENQKCLDFLLHDIPTEDIVLIICGLVPLNYGSRKPEDGNVNWASVLSYSPGMIEQGTIDTAGRLLNGLDKHPQLAKKVAKKLKRDLNQNQRKMQPVALLVSEAGRIDPPISHCINLDGSMKKLQKMVSSILGKSNTKPWKSTFLIDRQYIDNPDDIYGEDDKLSKKRACHFCHKEPEGKVQMCARCKTVFYCSRECQVKDWKTHKKDCVKHSGVVPSEKSAHTGHLNYVLQKIQDEGAMKTKG